MTHKPCPISLAAIVATGFLTTTYRGQEAKLVPSNYNYAGVCPLVTNEVMVDPFHQDNDAGFQTTPEVINSYFLN